MIDQKQEDIIGHCPFCGEGLTDSNVIHNRDGSVYDPNTNFWDICPHCDTTLPEDWDE